MKRGSKGLWVVVYMASGAQTADAVERLLTSEGFLVRRVGLSRAVTGSEIYELSVLASEAREARNVLTDNGL